MGPRYNPALDGLRAIAVLMVLGFHTHAPWLQGGSRGVDVFFVLSGFLITRILREQQEADGIELAQFWLRRARRLVPALLLMLSAYVLLAPVLLPDHADARWADAAKAGFYLTDYWFKPTGPLIHTWSLAIEEQFYLIWPFAVMLLVRLPKPWLALLIMWLAVSFLRVAWIAVPGADIVSGYYNLHTHASGLILGAALTYAPKTLPRGLGLAGVALLVLDLALDGGMTGQLLWNIALGEIAAALIVLDLQRPGLLRNVLAFEPLRLLGLISYGVYLWHLPIANALAGAPYAVQVIGTVLLSVALAALSYVTVERWVRRLPVRLRAVPA